MRLEGLLIVLLAIFIVGCHCKSPKGDSLKSQANSWSATKPSTVAVNFDFEHTFSHDRWLGKVDKNIAESPSQPPLTDESSNKITRTERLIRYIVYWITLGFFLDLAIYYARYDRTNSNHDEFHAALMILCFLAGLSMDIWFIVRQSGMFFKGTLNYDVYFGLICATNAFAIPQLIYGNIIRFKMRDPVNGTNYLSQRRIHKPLGILIYVLTKAKLFYLHEVEQSDKVLFPNVSFNIHWIFVAYLVLLVIFWTVLNVLFINKPGRFRDKVMRDNTGRFSTAVKKVHSNLLDLRTDGTLDHDNLALYKDCIWVTFEDRVFDVTDLDHPGGRFILSTIKGKDVSRFMVGGLEYNDTDSRDHIVNRHSPFALNLLEKMFIGFIKIPAVLIRYDLMEDGDVTVMGLKKLVQLKDDHKKKLVNNAYHFDFKVSDIEVLAPTIDKVTLTSSNVEVCLSENPFLLFGKYLNFRVKDWDGLSPFDLVLSRSNNFEKIKANILAHFYTMFPQFRGRNVVNVKEPVDVETLIKKKRKLLRKNSTQDNIQHSTTVIVAPADDINTESISLLVKSGGNDYVRKLKNTPKNTTIFDIKGPFGPGLGITRFSFGVHLLCATDTGVFSFLDLIDYLCRFYIYRYAQSKSPQPDHESLQQLDPFSDDFDLTFNNLPTFYILLDLQDRQECDALVKNDLTLIAAIENDIKLGVVGGISIRLQKAELNYEAEVPGVSLSKTKKWDAKAVLERLDEIGVTERGSLLDQKVEKAIMAGHKGYLRDLREGLIAAGVNKTKFKSL